MKYISRFQLEPCEKITIQYFNKLSDLRDGIPAQKEATVTDEKLIRKIFLLLSHLPNKGDVMKKMGDAALLKVMLEYRNKTIYFAFYDQLLKTPATSFYSFSPLSEKKLYDMLMRAGSIQ